MTADLRQFATEDVCYLTTTGRVSGRPHTIEIWFALHEHTLYMLSGAREKADWVKNALHLPAVSVKINDVVFPGKARLLTNPEEDALARRLLFDKYTSPDEEDLSEWSSSALSVAVDLIV